MLELDSLSSVGAQLQVTLKNALDSIPNVPHRPQELAKTLRVNKNLTSRLCAALRARDPLATMSLVPGPVPLRQMLRAASALGADRAQVKLASLAVEQFEAVIRDEFDDRAGLDAVLGTMVPEMRRRHELAAKQAVFRGMESIKGISSDTALVTFIVHPCAAAPERADVVMIGAYFGLRRVRPGAPIQFTAQLGRILGQDSDRRPLPAEDPDGPLLREFCQPADIRLTRTDLGELACYEVAGSAIGRSSAIDLVLAEHYPRRTSTRGQPAQGRVRHFDATIEQPCKLFVLDLLVHESVWPGAEFDLRVYDTTIKGMVDPNDALRRKDQFRLAEGVQNMGRGLGELRMSKLPRYVELLENVTAHLGWDGARLRGYRCQMAYPVYGSQLCIAQRTADAPSPPSPAPIPPG